MKESLLQMQVGDILDISKDKVQSMRSTKTRLKNEGLGTWQSKNSLNGYQVKRTS